jgi:hypothetical protein
VSLGFLLSWAGADLSQFPFRLEAPDGTVIDTADRTRQEGRTSFTWNRVKSRSADQSSETPWQRQRAAMRASCTLAPVTCPAASKRASTGQ